MAWPLVLIDGGWNDLPILITAGGQLVGWYDWLPPEHLMCRCSIT